MIIRTLTLLAVFFITTLHADSQDMQFAFSCKILDQVGINLEDGKSETFQDYKYEDFEAESLGDTMWIWFTFTDKPNTSVLNDYTLQISANIKKRPLFLADITKKNWDFWNQQQEMLIWKTHEGKQILGNNIINISNQEAHSTSITGKRYYKNDWNFIIKSGRYSSAMIHSVNCIGMSNDFEKMREIISTRHN